MTYRNQIAQQFAVWTEARVERYQSDWYATDKLHLQNIAWAARVLVVTARRFV